jgi:Choline/Carnitine o-acyltransferase
MALSLDHTTYIIPPISLSSHKHTRTTTQNALDSHVHAIRGTNQNISNRFFDKPFTIIVDPSTRAGASGEHSPVDALVPSIVAEYGIVQGVDTEAFEFRGTGNEVDGKGWERLDWVADEKMWKECQAATERANAIVNNSDDSVLWFDKFGSNWINSFGSFLLFLLPSSKLNFFCLIFIHRQLQTFSRCIHPNGNPASVVQNPRRIHSYIRNGPNPNV